MYCIPPTEIQKADTFVSTLWGTVQTPLSRWKNEQNRNFLFLFEKMFGGEKKKKKRKEKFSVLCAPSLRGVRDA